MLPNFRKIVIEGVQDYTSMLEKQYQTMEEVRSGGDPVLYLLEHKPVVTLGRRTKEEHLVLDKEQLAEKGIDLVRVQRGGSATYHGPGQLVGYVICKVSTLGGTYNLVKKVLQLVKETIESFGIQCKIDDDNPGVWTADDNPRKLAAVGMQIKEGYSLHGFAINVDLPLTPFTYIVPCGLSLPVSTLSVELGRRVSISELREWILLNFDRIVA